MVGLTILRPTTRLLITASTIKLYSSRWRFPINPVNLCNRLCFYSIHLKLKDKCTIIFENVSITTTIVCNHNIITWFNKMSNHILRCYLCRTISDCCWRMTALGWVFIEVKHRCRNKVSMRSFTRNSHISHRICSLKITRLPLGIIRPRYSTYFLPIFTIKTCFDASL